MRATKEEQIWQGKARREVSGKERKKEEVEKEREIMRRQTEGERERARETFDHIKREENAVNFCQFFITGLVFAQRLFFFAEGEGEG
jgi:hypothetical protein